jgi:hypothetical protein
LLYEDVIVSNNEQPILKNFLCNKIIINNNYNQILDITEGNIIFTAAIFNNLLKKGNKSSHIRLI